MISMMTKESTGWIFGGRILANVKASGARSEDQKVIGRIITVNNMAIITRKKEKLLLLLRLAQMQQTQPVSWYCNLFYDAFHSAIKIFTSPLLFWVKKNMGRALGFCTP